MLLIKRLDREYFYLCVPVHWFNDQNCAGLYGMNGLPSHTYYFFVLFYINLQLVLTLKKAVKKALTLELVSSEQLKRPTSSH